MKKKIESVLIAWVFVMTSTAVVQIGCATGTVGPEPPIPVVGRTTLEGADISIKIGYDWLNALAQWHYDHRAELKKDGALTTQLRAAKSKLWKAIGNSTRRRDALAKDKPAPVAEEQLQAALAELEKVISTTADFMERKALRPDVL